MKLILKTVFLAGIIYAVATTHVYRLEGMTIVQIADATLCVNHTGFITLGIGNQIYQVYSSFQ